MFTLLGCHRGVTSHPPLMPMDANTGYQNVCISVNAIVATDAESLIREQKQFKIEIYII